MAAGAGNGRPVKLGRVYAWNIGPKGAGLSGLVQQSHHQATANLWHEPGRFGRHEPILQADVDELPHRDRRQSYRVAKAAGIDLALQPAFITISSYKR